ncbi:MAG: GNAT family N-acetyltransferase, partial [Acidobacteria bacterium]|nr:GNAT family N-acetyltransferase [Acidobacteriota bacterium]
RDSFRALASARASGEVRDLAGISIASAGVAFQMFNAAFLAAPIASEAELVQRILQAAVHFNARGLEWAYWVCTGWMEEKVRRRARRIFDRQNLHFSVELPGMIAERLLPPERKLPAMEFRRVREQPTRAAFCAIGSLCFNVPLAWFTEVFENDLVWDKFVGYVGYVGGEPVSTAATVTSAGAIGVYNVATIPGHQRSGYGEAIMRHALQQARAEHDIERTILQSTPQGFPLYLRMGYRTVTKVSVYAS